MGTALRLFWGSLFAVRSLRDPVAGQQAASSTPMRRPLWSRERLGLSPGHPLEAVAKRLEEGEKGFHRVGLRGRRPLCMLAIRTPPGSGPLAVCAGRPLCSRRV